VRAVVRSKAGGAGSAGGYDISMIDSISRGVSRRRFVAQTAALGAGLALDPARRLLADEGGRWFKIGICDWMLGRTNPTVLKLAKEVGVDGVQLNMGTLANDMHLRKPEVRQAYLDAAKKADLEISSLAIGEMNSVPLKSDPRAEPWLFDSVDVAVGLGVKVILVAFFGKNDLKGDKPGTDRVVDLLKQAAPKAEKAGVIYGVESWLNAEEHMDILDRVGSPAVKVYYDVGNSHLRGYDIYREIRWLGRKNLCEFHAKDHEFLFGEGKIDFEEVRRAMDDVGFSGWIQIEGQAPLGMIESYRRDREYLKRVFPPRV
jgi:sugar phosphate isomerase/epimerase